MPVSIEETSTQSLNFVVNDNFSNDIANGNNSMGAKSSSEEKQMRVNNERNSRRIVTIGEKVGLLEYSLREWQGNTAKAATIRKVRTDMSNGVNN